MREVLDGENVYYKADTPKETGIQQIFLFDPDGNVLEISNCAPKIGDIKCSEDDNYCIKENHNLPMHPEPVSESENFMLPDGLLERNKNITHVPSFLLQPHDKPVPTSKFSEQVYQQEYKNLPYLPNAEQFSSPLNIQPMRLDTSGRPEHQVQTRGFKLLHSNVVARPRSDSKSVRGERL